MADASIAEISGALLAARRVLIVTHERPDGDALGSAFGMRSFLRKKQIGADVFLKAEVPYRYRSILGDGPVSADAVRVSDFDLVLSLDCANGERLASPESAEFLAQKNFINVDHHAGNSIPGRLNFVDPSASSTCEIAARIAEFSTPELDPETAGFFLMGMMTDTGSFKFSNTTGRALRSAARLLENGADLEKIVNTLFFSNPLKQLLLEADLVENKLKTAFGGRFIYAFIDDAMLKKHDFDLREDEGLIDVLRGIDTAVVVMLASEKDGAFKISMRSKDRRVPVLEIARRFSGGGHAMAAGATLRVKSFADVESAVLPEVEASLKKAGF